jgi:hypothetical protein
VTDKNPLFTDDQLTVEPVEGRYVCAQCGSPGSPYPGFKPIDPRYTTGLCTGVHRGPQYLVREDVLNTERKKRKKVT